MTKGAITVPTAARKDVVASLNRSNEFIMIPLAMRLFMPQEGTKDAKYIEDRLRGLRIISSCSSISMTQFLYGGTLTVHQVLQSVASTLQPSLLARHLSRTIQCDRPHIQ